MDEYTVLCEGAIGAVLDGARGAGDLPAEPLTGPSRQAMERCAFRAQNADAATIARDVLRQYERDERTDRCARAFCSSEAAASPVVE